MTDIQEMICEDPLPGHESKLDPKPEWQPRYSGSGRLNGKVAIVTGADSGIGRAVAALYAREGADVAIFYLLEEDDASETQRIVEAEGRRAITIRADVGSRKMCDHVAQRVLEVFGQIDILVNNAGEQHPDEDITEEQLQRTFQTNIFGMFHMVQAVRPYLQSGAAIVNCTSVDSFHPIMRTYSEHTGKAHRGDLVICKLLDFARHELTILPALPFSGISVLDK